MKTILYSKEKKAITHDPNASFFNDLNLDVIFDNVQSRAFAFNIKDYFYESVTNEEDILYRQGVFKDLISESLCEDLSVFSNVLNHIYGEMKVTNKFPLLRKIEHRQKLDHYIEIIESFLEKAKNFKLSSKALNDFVLYINEYAKSDIYNQMKEESKSLKDEILEVKYLSYYSNGNIKISKYIEQTPLKDKFFSILDEYEIENSLSFQSISFKVADNIINELYLAIMDYYPKLNNDLDMFYNKYLNFFDDNIYNLIREIQFYLSYYQLTKDISNSNLKFNIPKITNKKLDCLNGFDIALAINYKELKKDIVPNDFNLASTERTYIISGPNQGGKTTFSRFFGQTFYLASLGLLVSGTAANVPLITNICTMYEKEENASNLNGKLKTELLTIKEVLDQVKDNSIVILNEVFSSTSHKDGVMLGEKIIEELHKKKAICLFVTFLDELANYKDYVVGMQSVIDENNPEIRTYKIIRTKQKEMIFAKAVALKNSVTYEDIIRRL